MLSKYLLSLSVLAWFSAANAHTLLWGVDNAGIKTGLRNIRTNNPGDYQGDPIMSVYSSEMRCNKAGGTPVTPRTVNPGQTFFFRFVNGQTDGSGPEILDPSHVGPCLVYAAPGPAATEWVKLFHEGIGKKGDVSSWCTRKLIRNGGFQFTLPSNMPAGRWVLRIELIALHNAFEENSAQMYVRCMDINVTGSNTGVASPIVHFPGAYSGTEPGIKYDLYGDDGNVQAFRDYIIPGGPVGGFKSTGSAPPPSPLVPSPSPSPKAVSPVASPKISPVASPKVSPAVSPVPSPAAISIASAPKPTATNALKFNLKDWDFCDINAQCVNGCCSREYSHDNKFKCTPGGTRSKCTGTGLLTAAAVSPRPQLRNLKEWDFCTSSSQCANECCSNEYSDDGKFKCTPGTENCL
ncbi:hypothetical protein HK098_005677 [Nowakowskiella sp. JEL0407]|nr:hypothetical protein HK098_005677 [Nowakowskiella sp. JEL0407]